MKLSVQDRLVLSGILPRRNDYETLLKIKELRERIKFSDDESKELKFRDVVRCAGCNVLNVDLAKEFLRQYESDPKRNWTEAKLSQELTKVMNSRICRKCSSVMNLTGEVAWQKVERGDRLIALEKEIKITAVMKSLVSRILKKMNTDGELTDDHVSLYERFVKGVR